MSGYNNDDNNYTWSQQTGYAGAQSSRYYYYPTPSSSRQNSTDHSMPGSMRMATPQEDAHHQGWDVEARAGSFDGDMHEQDPREDQGPAAEQTNDANSQRQYTNQYVDNLDAPLGYRDDTGGQTSSPRSRARRRVHDVVNADYTGQGSSSGSASGQGSSRQHKSSKHHHGHKTSKHSSKDTKRHGQH